MVRMRSVLMAAAVLVLAGGYLLAQPAGRAARGGLEGLGGSITGSVVDSLAQTPLEYANIILFDARDGSQVDGTISVKDGSFNLAPIRPGVFDLEVKFMGFHAKRIRGIRLAPPEMEVDLGTIALTRAVISLDEVEVSAEKPDLLFKIDKKVINVDKQIAARGGTAVDVLENVPSVTVDIEGNVSLRGSSSFTVLVDNKPTVLEPNEVLQQIPASTIDNIEIITNPSAKYDPDGVSGIINVITKKSKLGGTSGIVNLNGGLDHKYGGDFLLSHRGGNVSTYAGFDYNRRESPGTSRSESRTYQDTVASFVNSSGSSRRKGTTYSGKAGIEIGLAGSDVLSLEAKAGRRSWGGVENENFVERTDPGSERSYISRSENDRKGDFYQGSLDYQHGFGAEGHRIVGRAVGIRYDGDEESVTELLDRDRVLTSGRRSAEDGPSSQLRLEMEYTMPLDKERRFEAGYEGRLDRTETSTKFYEYDPDSLHYVFRNEFSHSTEYQRDIHAAYVLYAGALGRLGYQAGIRTEHVDRLTRLVGEGQTYTIDRWDFFPTLHVSYAYSEGNQVMTSYARRIDRPRSWYLEPFITWSDAYNVQQGNPSLKPEYIDSYELGYQKNFGPSMVSVEAYYRLTHNKVERVQSVYRENVILHSVENVGRDYTFGSEVMSNLALVRWWNLNLMGNLYDYQVKGTLYGDDFSEESFDWSVRANNTFKLSGATRIQVNSFYNSPTVSAQGKRKGFYSTDLGIRQDLVNRTLSLALQVRDVFRTGKFEFTSEGPDFYNYRRFTRKSPSVTLALTYNFNNYKPEQEKPADQDIFGGEEEF
jgi:outer membrane receptor protein involved in Fe transport